METIFHEKLFIKNILTLMDGLCNKIAANMIPWMDLCNKPELLSKYGSDLKQWVVDGKISVVSRKQPKPFRENPVSVLSVWGDPVSVLSVWEDPSKQEGSLCAQHCLNALLQGGYFTAVDLAMLAQQIDEEERSRMAEGGVYSEDYRRFLEQPSGNVDDSGYFSVQVIASALKVWNLDLIPYNSQDPVALSAQKDPTQHKAYICNYRDHWLTIRKIGYQWFNLNSLLTGPELISNTYLALFLAQLQQEGYSIFIVMGILPECEPDKVLCLNPAVQLEKPRLLSEVKAQQGLLRVQQKRPSARDDDDVTFNKALQMSLESSMQEEDQDLQAALSMSLSDFQGVNPQKQPLAVNSECSTSLRVLGVNSETQTDNHVSAQQQSSLHHTESMSEQEMLEKALKMSMEAS